MRVQDFRPGWRTDFILHRFGAEVRELADCVVVRSPGNEGFFWGNCLMIAETPADADLAHWLQRFEDEVAHGRPGVRHVAIGVNSSPPGPDALPAWRAAGFELMETATLRLQPGQLRAIPPASASPLQLRTMAFDTEIEAFVALQSADPQGYEPEGWTRFRRQQMQRFARVHAAGQGEWFGLWCGDTLVADCGLLRDGTLGRFQSVLTHPDWRRRGLCHALVHSVCRWGFEQWGLTELLMCADPDDVAIGIYESLGFQRFDREWGLQRNPPEDEAARRSVRLGQNERDLA
ncbi:MAG: GNAT family N-acetyltransferase [Burkholderiaceae bacterium]